MTGQVFWEPDKRIEYIEKYQDEDPLNLHGTMAFKFRLYHEIWGVWTTVKPGPVEADNSYPDHEREVCLHMEELFKDAYHATHCVNRIHGKHGKWWLKYYRLRGWVKTAKDLIEEKA